MGIVKMPFGKHKDVPLTNLPEGYLDWCCASLMGKRKLHAALMEEARRREHGEPIPSRRVRASSSPLSKEAKKIYSAYVKAGYLGMAKKCHPDKGGTADDMLAIQEVRTWLDSFS